MNYQKYVSEVRTFLIYAKLIWPLHRFIARRYITPRCVRCIASANLYPLNQDGICSQCLRPPSFSSIASTDPKVKAQLDECLRNFCGQGSGEFDALVLFSGGKDSVYMVDRIKREYPQMRMLLFTVDNSFMSPVAMKNIADLVKRMNIPSEMNRPPPSFYEKIYRAAFLNLNAKGCSGTVDQFDGDLFHDVARNYAAQHHIPLVLSGCSKTQVMRVLDLNHFEFPRSFEAQSRVEVAGIKLRDILSDEEMKYWWNPAVWDESVHPRVIFPFYAWDVDQQAVIKAVTEQGLLPAGASNPLLTNSQLVPLMAMVDMVKLGYSSFEPEFTEMVREGKADAKLWKNIFELSEYAAKTGQLVSASVDQALQRLHLTRQQMGLPA